MVDVVGNCFEVQGDKVLFGIPYQRRKDFVGPLPIDSADYITGNRLEFAWFKLSKQHTKQKLFSSSAKGAWKKGVIVYVEVFGLHFGGSPYLPGLDIWPGVEGDRMTPFWKSSSVRPSHREINHAQIWLLRENSSLSICDRFGGLRLLKFFSGELTLVEPTPAEVITYFRQHIQDHNDKRRTWALRNIKLLLDVFPDAEGMK